METEYVIYKTEVAQNSWDEIILKFEYSYPTEQEAITHVETQLSTMSGTGPFIIVKQYSRI